MEERKTEIGVQRDVLRAEAKLLLQEVHSVTVDLNARLAQVDKLKARFDAVARSADEEVKNHSQKINPNNVNQLNATNRDTRNPTSSSKQHNDVKSFNVAVMSLSISLEWLSVSCELNSSHLIT